MKRVTATLSHQLTTAYHNRVFTYV